MRATEPGRSERVATFRDGTEGSRFPICTVVNISRDLRTVFQW